MPEIERLLLPYFGRHAEAGSIVLVVGLVSYLSLVLGELVSDSDGDGSPDLVLLGDDGRIGVHYGQFGHERVSAMSAHSVESLGKLRSRSMLRGQISDVTEHGRLRK